MITQFFVCWDYSWQVSSVIPTIILANVGRHRWTLSLSRPNIEYFNEGPSRSRGLFWGDTDHPWPQYPRRLASDDRRATQYCNLEIFPRLTGPGCHDSWRVTHFMSRDPSWHIAPDNTQAGHRSDAAQNEKCCSNATRVMTAVMMIRLFVFALPRECFLWVSWCHLAKQSLNARIFATRELEKRAKPGPALALFVTTWRLMSKLISKYDILQSSKCKKQVIFGSGKQELC